jgi:hypothetical protein
VDVRKREAIQAIDRIVRRSVIDNEQLPVPVRLRDDRCDGLFHKSLPVPCGYHDGYEGIVIHGAPCVANRSGGVPASLHGSHCREVLT